MGALVEYFVSRSIFVNLLTFLLILMGGYTAATINREAFPNISFDIVTVVTVYPGASPEEVEKLVTKPLEDNIKSVDGIKKINSSSIENRSGITITIDPDTEDPQKVIDDIRSAVDRTTDLPDGIEERPLVQEITSARQPVIEVTVTQKPLADGSYKLSELELREQARVLERKLLDQPYVARVVRKGWKETEMQVELSPALLDKYYVAAVQIVSALAGRNLNMPGGKLEIGREEIIVRTIGEFNTAEEVAGVYIRSNETGKHVQVRDVGAVREGFKESTYLEGVNGQDAISLTVLKRESADIIKTVDAVKATVESFKKSGAPDVLEFSYVNDLSYFVKRRLSVLMGNGASGFVLVILSLFVFLNWRSALMTAMGIPIALGLGFVVMSYMGVTLNLIAMFGMVLVIGIIVDDAIVVCENCYRYLEEGFSAYDAVILGTKEVIAPVTATITTTVAAFAPLLFVTGIFGKFLYTIPLVVIITLLASLFEAFIILPSHVYDIHKHADIKKALEATHRREGWFDRLRKERYEPLLKWSLDNHKKVMLGMNGLFVMMIILTGTFGDFKLFPGAIETLQIKITANQRFTKEATMEYAKVIESAVGSLPATELENFTTRIGIQQKDPNDPFTRRGSNYGQILVFLTPEQSRDRSAEEIIVGLRKQTEWLLMPEARARNQSKDTVVQIGFFARLFGKKVEPVPPLIPAGYDHLADSLVALDMEKISGGPPVGKPVAIQIIGDDFEILKKIAAEYKAVLGQIKGVQDIDDDFDEAKDEVRLKINEGLAAQAGVSVQQIALAVNTALEGNVATTIKRPDEEVDVRVRFSKEFRESENVLGRIFVSNQQGNLIPVSRLARFERDVGILAVNHLDGKRLVTVTANVDEKVISSTTANNEATRLGKDIPARYPAYQIKLGGEYEDTAESLTSLRNAFLVGFIIIFMILASLFKSLIQPAVVVMAIPFSFIGVAVAFLTHGEPFSFLGFMGIIGLAGVVVNDSIVLVDFANNIHAKEPDLNIKDVVLRAASLRLRAVMLTTITTVLGLLPTAYGIGGFDPFLVPMALSFSWGLGFATVLTLIVVPILYMYAYKMRVYLTRLVWKENFR
ncbi:MAG: efflux RND transporter permease subunit [Spirochaetales bacterium]|nr:efflux RND transporter permease subunit [Spirochaetales bacterium]